MDAASLENLIGKLPATVPAGPPPPGETSDLDAPNPWEPALVGVNATFIALTTLVVLMRSCTRLFIVRSWWWDDTLIVVATLCSLTYFGLQIYGPNIGYGRHLWNTPLNLLTHDHNAIQLVSAVIYPLGLFFVKLSVCALIWRLFIARGRAVRVALQVIIAACCIIYIALVSEEIGNTVICSYAYNELNKPFCQNDDIANEVTGALNIVTDVYLITLPVCIVMGIHMSLKRKIGIMIIFLTGILSTVASTIRLAWIVQHGKNGDPLYDGAELGILATIELGMGVLAASFSTLPKLYEASKKATLSQIHLLSQHSALSLRRRNKSSQGSDVSEPRPIVYEMETKSPEQTSV